MMLPVTEVPQQYPGPVEYHLDKQVEMGGHIHATELYLVLPGSSAVQPVWYIPSISRSKIKMRGIRKKNQVGR